jgi:hypothetical protein
MPMVPFDTDDIRDHPFSPWLLPGCRNSQGIVADNIRHDDLNGSIWLDYDELYDECDTRTIERPVIVLRIVSFISMSSVILPIMDLIIDRRSPSFIESFSVMTPFT